MDEAKELPLHELTYDLAVHYHQQENTLIDKPLANAFQLLHTVDENIRDDDDGDNDQGRYHIADDEQVDNDSDDDYRDARDNNNLEIRRNDAVCNIKLMDCLMYLRQVHCYCLFCGTSYNDTMDLQQSCPGIEEDEH